MKKIGLFLLPLIGVFIATLIIGSFFDFEINHAIFSNMDTFGLTISVLGTIPGYAMFAFIGGGAAALAVHRDYKTWIKVVLYVSAVACLGSATFFAGREFFGPNGFTDACPKIVGYVISFPIMSGVTVLGYFMCKKSEQEYLWLFLLIMLVALIIALVPGVTLLKSIFHRPRFRSIETFGLDFHPWYEPSKDYLLYPESMKEEFKSFPSGHAGASIAFPTMVLFLPFIKKEYSKYVLPCFIAGLAWALLVMFARMLVGAHFLSDVSIGALLTTTMMLVALFVLKGFKKKLTI